MNKIIQGDSLSVLKTLPSESINCCVTSPPYWALRDYGVDGQLGLEPTFQEYINKLCNIFDEVKRVLRKDGTCWVNIGDTYWGGGNNRGSSEENLSAKQFSNRGARGQCSRDWDKSFKPKCLLQIPSRFSIEMCNRGWILRNTIIWHKPNCMPSSVKDRFTVDFEYVFFFVKSKKYWFETQYEPHSTKEGPLRNKNKESSNKGYPDGDRFSQGLRTGYGKEGRNKRTVWKINTKPFKEAHFAVFPEELVETPIKAGCPKGGTVLDCFCGSGTSGVVAQRQEKDFIGIELNPEYIEIAKNRLDKGKSIWT